MNFNLWAFVVVVVVALESESYIVTAAIPAIISKELWVAMVLTYKIILDIPHLGLKITQNLSMLAVRD